MLLRRQSIKKALFVFTQICYIIAGVLIMPEIDNVAEQSTHNLIIYELIAYSSSLLCLFFFIIDNSSRVKTAPTITIFILFYIFSFISTILHLQGYSYIIYVTYPLLPLLISYLYTCQYGIDKLFINLAFIALIAVSIQYIRLFSIANYFSANRIGVSYFPLFILPIVLLHDSKTIKTISWIITSVIIVSSLKRGGLIALVLGILAYALVKVFITNDKSHKARTIIVILIVLLATGMVGYYMIDMIGSNVIERISTISDDGGSGRTTIWTYMIDKTFSSTPDGIILGHGYLATPLVNIQRGDAAHNDFIEILYDFGLIGCVLYIAFFIFILKDIITGIKRKDCDTPQFTLMYVIYFVLTMVSIVYFYFYITYINLMLGLVLGNREYRCKHQVE